MQFRIRNANKNHRPTDLFTKNLIFLKNKNIYFEPDGFKTCFYVEVKLSTHSCKEKKKQWIKNGGNLRIHWNNIVLFQYWWWKKKPNIAIKHAKFDNHYGSIHVIWTRLEKNLRATCSNIYMWTEKVGNADFFPSDCSYTFTYLFTKQLI